jgi:hypothetical protein
MQSFKGGIVSRPCDSNYLSNVAGEEIKAGPTSNGDASSDDAIPSDDDASPNDAGANPSGGDANPSGGASTLLRA